MFPLRSFLADFGRFKRLSLSFILSMYPLEFSHGSGDSITMHAQAPEDLCDVHLPAYVSIYFPNSLLVIPVPSGFAPASNPPKI